MSSTTRRADTLGGPTNQGAPPAEQLSLLSPAALPIDPDASPRPARSTRGLSSKTSRPGSRARATSERPSSEAEGSSECHYAKVALFVPLSDSYSFSLPEHLRHLQPGSRVVCELRGRQTLGVVLDVAYGDPGCPVSRLKPLLGVVNEEPAVPGELLLFLRELADYYLAPLGEVLRLAVPTLERSAKTALGEQGLLQDRDLNAVGRLVQYVIRRAESELTPDERARALVLKGQAAEIYAALVPNAPVRLSTLTPQYKTARSATKKLVSLGLCSLDRRSDLTAHEGTGETALPPIVRDTPPELNQAQKAAVSAIIAAMTGGTSQNFLLHGVTASGKTEVYLHAVEKCLEQGGGALVLVPEIALTPQLLSRFRARLGDTVAVLHSGLGVRERTLMWKRLREGTLRVGLGARSALFAPVSNLRLVCVDEEQDGSFKQEEGVRYNARDMALLRAVRAKAVCVLGSATPSLKSFHATMNGKLERLVLPERAHQAAVLPTVEVVDLRRFGPGPTGDRWLSLPLFRALEASLQAKQQAILFLNRRGFAPSITCEACGQVLQCPSCEVALTYHIKPSPHVICHYCDYRGAVPSECSACHSAALSFEGLGTERVEAVLSECFPLARVGRLDRDTGAGLKSEGVLERMRRGELDILVGTQMVTKGHDLPNVGLVGVLNADAALSLPDFQASERTFQLLVQVAGRAGRASVKGKVVVQAYNPDHPAVRLALSHDVLGFAKYALDDRAALNYPPYSRLALVRMSAIDETVAKHSAQLLASVARRAAGSHAEILGPAPAPLPRLRSRYRYRFLVRTTKRVVLRHVLSRVMEERLDARVRLVVDVDPCSML